MFVRVSTVAHVPVAAATKLVPLVDFLSAWLVLVVSKQVVQHVGHHPQVG